MVRYLTYLINMFRPADDPFAFTKAQFWAVYSGAEGASCQALRAKTQRSLCRDPEGCTRWPPPGCVPDAAIASHSGVAAWQDPASPCLPASPPISYSTPPPAATAGFILLHGVFNAISVKLLGFLSIVSVVFHVGGTLAIVIGGPPAGMGVPPSRCHAPATSPYGPSPVGCRSPALSLHDAGQTAALPMLRCASRSAACAPAGLPIIARVRQPASWVFGHFEVRAAGEPWAHGRGPLPGPTLPCWGLCGSPPALVGRCPRPA